MQNPAILRTLQQAVVLGRCRNCYPKRIASLLIYMHQTHTRLARFFVYAGIPRDVLEVKICCPAVCTASRVHTSMRCPFASSFGHGTQVHVPAKAWPKSSRSRTAYSALLLKLLSTPSCPAGSSHPVHHSLHVHRRLSGLHHSVDRRHSGDPRDDHPVFPR